MPGSPLGYPSCVITREVSAPKTARTVARRAALAVSVAAFVLLSVPVAAFADTPSTWAKQPHVSGLQYLVVLFLIPMGLFIVITLLAALPSMISDKGYEPGQSWRSEAEWFGGPRKGVGAADELSSAQIEAAETDRGGTSGTW
ncbi:MAG: hypothetical protein JWQ32_1909 [Marmoricola sp.]|nr:hypothetical protein [Marmoricola sp.]